MGMFDRFDRVVRCSQGHLYHTIWVPLASFKSLRLGPQRLQWCPVGKHWSRVQLVGEQSLSSEERQSAARYHDFPIP